VGIGLPIPEGEGGEDVLDALAEVVLDPAKGEISTREI
jgi:hypothetical protein